MQFNTFEFLFVFLPVVFLVFWAGRGMRWRMSVMVIASYLFYFYWDYRSGWRGGFTILLVGSTSIDYFAGRWMYRLPPEKKLQRKLLLLIPICINVGLLATFKYAGFLWGSISDVKAALGGAPLHPLRIVLPIAISFYTFEAISQIVDIYRGVTKPAPSFLEYACFISFFPREISGPIVRYSDMDHQFDEKRATGWRGPDWNQINIGLMLFTMGMAKKVLVADRIAEVIKPIWTVIGTSAHVDQRAAWAATLGYTFQLYFDFSGYSDMAVGLGHFFGLKLPQNFDSPYKATDAMQFWRRWHITLSMWLRDYLYIPMGGNRTGHRMRNLMLTLLLGGLWHGAGWQFLFWGGWHGLLLVGYHQAREHNWIPADTNIINRFVNRQVMFFLVIVGWVMFRAPHLRDAIKVFGDWFGAAAHQQIRNVSVPGWFFVAMLGCWLWCNVMPNSFEVAYASRQRVRYAVLAGTAMAACVFFFGSKTDFLYFQF